MFKRGDRVLCIESISLNIGGPKKGEYYIVISTNEDSIGIYLPNCIYDVETRTGAIPNWGKDCFRMADKQDKDFFDLDMIKFNEDNYYV